MGMVNVWRSEIEGRIRNVPNDFGIVRIQCPGNDVNIFRVLHREEEVISSGCVLQISSRETV